MNKLNDIVFISVDPWQEDRWARKQMLAYKMSQRSNKVFYYVDPNRSERKTPLVKRVNSNLYVVDIPYIPGFLRNTSYARWGSKLASFTIWFLLKFHKIKNPVYMIYQPHNLEFAKKLASIFGKSLLCYDLTDDWSEFPGMSNWRKAEIEREEKRVIREVDLVFAVSKKLESKASVLNPNTHYVPNATSFDNFNKVTKPLEIAPEIAKTNEPRIGYVGKINPWRVDFDLLKYVATQRPDWSIIMIGPINPEAKPLAQELSRLKNVSFLGPKPYFSMAKYIKGFTACILPHKVDSLTESMDPIKLYDYMATGKPIVATNISEARKFEDCINIADNKEEFVGHLENIVLDKVEDNPKTRIEIARENSWENRTSEVNALINHYIEENPQALSSPNELNDTNPVLNMGKLLVQYPLIFIFLIYNLCYSIVSVLLDKKLKQIDVE